MRSSGDALAQQSGGERLAGAAQLGPFQGDRPGGRLHGQLGVAVAMAGSSTLTASVAVAAQELGDFGFQRGLQQQAGAEPGDLLKSLAKVTVGGEQLVDLGADALHRRYSCGHGRGPPQRELLALLGAYARPTFPPLPGRHPGVSPGRCGPSGAKLGVLLPSPKPNQDVSSPGRASPAQRGEYSQGCLRSKNSGSPTLSAAISFIWTFSSGGGSLRSSSRVAASEVKYTA